MRPQHELHVHLYGALDAESLWHAARDVEKIEDRISWYKNEFSKAYGRPSRIDDFWKRDDGLDLLKEEYVYREAGAFAKFQASINLPIALFPLSPSHCPLLGHSVKMHHQEGIQYVEYRILLAHYLSEEQRQRYLSMIAETAARLQANFGGEIKPRIIYSLARNTEICVAMYASLKTWQHNHPKLARFVTGIDFCASERGFPPKDKQTFMQKLHADNRADPEHALAVLYHVGETFEHLRPESAIRWICEANELGAHRLGHCVALGVDPQALLHTSFTEPMSERRDHIDWLFRNRSWLMELGYSFDEKELSRERLGDDDVSSVTIDHACLLDLNALQSAVWQKLKRDQAVIETCPTSNHLIAKLDHEFLPSLRFLADQDLQVVIGADDPGIFNTTLMAEYQLCSKLGIASARLEKCHRDARHLSAARLCGRED